MKKIISAALAVIMSLSMTAAVMAEDANPKVFFNSHEIKFNDQKAVIEGDRTLVPARGVFEIMKSYVQWDGEKRRVQIDSGDNLTRVYLFIDNPVMEVYHFTSMFDSEKTEVTLDVAPQIINDRTMIPLRAISEAMDCKVEWNQEKYSVFIENELASAPTEGKTAVSLSASADTVAVGETVDVYVNIKNLPEGKNVSGVSALIAYSPDDFEFVDSDLYYEGEVVDGLKSSNGTYELNAAKASMITTNNTIVKDGTIARFTFKAKTTSAASFQFVNSFDTARGYNTSIVLSENELSEKCDGENLYVDMSELIINGGKAE